MSHNFRSKGAFDGFGKQSPYCQIGIGAGTGLVTGYVFFKASKSVAIAAGASILIVQLAMESGLVNFEVETIVMHGHQLNPNNIHVMPSIASSHSWEAIKEQLTKARDFLAGSQRLCVAMLGGFLVGFGLA
ncbi:FUN14 domain-containing protein fndc-1 [Drosophila pseudoobscura]|uniref:FUN14 domain-containing protein fndc-1 n=1 Tax=Drosophila pseudoobscura pseudoobscura TaxID=46245 RepID=A0A6I8UIN4_DROPS|nr:FUN14 domain-containing protein fndc-1 [Drosophila pseudoobscura]